MILEKEIEVVWNSANIKHFELLGYKFTKNGEKFFVPIEHLSDGSGFIVTSVCDKCSRHKKVRYFQYRDLCSACSKSIQLTNWNLNNKELMAEIISKTHKGKPKARGEKSHSWNPDRSYLERELHRGKPEYINWAKSVKERDNYVCQVCFVKNGDKHSHHLFSYLSYPDLRYEINNGVTLCPKCHRDFHAKYTNKNNTCHQFEEYKLYRQLHISLNSLIKV